tara:strand:- start:1466 stop:1675 length:210 start_codon:yes stop_codon:yes gene_type:complete
MSPIDMSREIVELLSDDEYKRAKAHTYICHELTAEQIKELYDEVMEGDANDLSSPYFSYHCFKVFQMIT